MHAALRRVPGQRRPGEHVGLDVDQHDVLAGGDGAQRVTGTDARQPGGLDHDLQPGRVEDVVERRRQVHRGELRRGPPGADEGRARPVEVEVDRGADLQPGEPAGLGEEHRPELAAAHERDAHGTPGLGPLAQALRKATRGISHARVLPCTAGVG